MEGGDLVLLASSSSLAIPLEGICAKDAHVCQGATQW